MCLVELVDFISKPGVLSTEELYMEFMRMVCCSTAAFVFSDGHFQMFSWLTNFKVVHYVYIFQFIHCIELLCVCACLFVPLWFVHTGCSLVVVGCPGGWLTSSATIITWPQLVQQYAVVGTSIARLRCTLLRWSDFVVFFLSHCPSHSTAFSLQKCTVFHERCTHALVGDHFAINIQLQPCLT